MFFLYLRKKFARISQAKLKGEINVFFFLKVHFRKKKIGCRLDLKIYVVTRNTIKNRKTAKIYYWNNFIPLEVHKARLS